MTGFGRSIDSFLPLRMLARLHESISERPSAIELNAAVLFIDVSRYTALAERLAQRGQGGLESISELLSHSYGRCVDEICDRGGEILYFEGDSLVACWEAGSNDLGSAARSAAECAKAVCDDHRNSASFGEATPTLHIGVGVGRLWVAAIGGRPVWNLIAGGDALTQAATSQASAPPGEFCLSERADEVIRQFTETTHAKLSIAVQPPADWLASFLPSSMRRHEQNGRTEVADSVDFDASAPDDDIGMSNEIRPISAVFVRIVGLDPLQLIPLSTLQSLCVSLQDILRLRDGPEGEFYVDEKGLIFSAAFGARRSFHRDDPMRAVDAARAMAMAIESLGLGASIGIATGHGLFCLVGNARRRQHMILGTAMNRAARLMMSVDSGILCDAPTERANRTAFTFEQRGTLQLDGLGDVSAVFRPLEPLASVSTSSKLIGRYNELAVMRRNFEDASAGGSRLLAILGEPGIGKTALVTAFRDELQPAGTKVSVVRAEREDRRTSLLAWRRVVASLLDLPADSNGSVVLDQLNLRLHDNPDLLERLPLLASVLGVAIAETDGTRHLDGPHRGDALMRLFGDLVAALASHPFVLIFEDGQWLDSASWRLIEWTLGSLSSLLVIICVRVEEIPDELKNLRRRAEATRLTGARSEASEPARFFQILDLDELDESFVREIVARTLGAEPPHPELATRITSLAAGNPFFAEEIAIALRSEGLIAVRDGFWRSIKPLDDLRYFEGVERVIRERVDLLDSQSFNLLKAASTIGRSFRIEALAVLLGETARPGIKDTIKTLIARHLLRAGRRSGDYEFRHDQIRDVVYSLISVDSRRKLHGLLADWIESQQTAAAEVEFSALVQHYDGAGNIEKAVKYADLAAARALQVGAFREVEAFLNICFNHESRKQTRNSERTLQAIRWRRQLAEAHYGRGDIHAQGVAVRRALTVAGEPVPSSPAATAVRLAGRGAKLMLRQIIPRATMTEHTDRYGRAKEIARCLSQAATVDYFELRYVRGMCNLVGAVEQAERLGPSVELAVASAQLGCGLSFLGWQRACDYFIARAERVAVSLSDPAVHSHVCVLDALWRMGRCDWAAIDWRLDLSQTLSTKAGDQLGWCNAQGMRFWSLYYRGDRVALEQTALALLSRAQNAGNVQQEIWALRCKALYLLHTDRPREAIDILRLIESAMQGSVDLAAQISAKGALAVALARAGQHGQSIEAAIGTLQLLRELRRPTSHSTLVGISGVTEVLLRGREAGLSHEYDQWSHWERQALGELKRYRSVFPLGAAQLGLWTGLAHWLDGKKRQAIAVWSDALATAEAFSLRHDASMIAAEMRRREDQA